MFTRRIIMSIKPGSAAEVGRIFRDEVIPPLRGQKGMRHDDTFISPALSEAVINSYWDTQEYAESYGRAAYPAALESLSKVLVGTPRVETFTISSSTFHQITAPCVKPTGLLRLEGAVLGRRPQLSATLTCARPKQRVWGTNETRSWQLRRG